jgi:hypothetical protein
MIDNPSGMGKGEPGMSKGEQLVAQAAQEWNSRANSESPLKRTGEL